MYPVNIEYIGFEYLFVQMGRYIHYQNQWDLSFYLLKITTPCINVPHFYCFFFISKLISIHEVIVIECNLNTCIFYRFKYIPNGKALSDDELKIELEQLTQSYIGRADKQLNLESTQANESFDKSVAKFAPKNRYGWLLNVRPHLR